MPNIAWNSLTGTQIREVIRMWPELPAYLTKGKSRVVIQEGKKAKLPVVDARVAKVPASKIKGVPTVNKRQKHTGADGEVKFVEHRNLYVGFFGGRVVVTKRTREACQEYLRNVCGVQVQG